MLVVLTIPATVLVIQHAYIVVAVCILGIVEVWSF